MSKVIVNYAAQKKSYPVLAANVVTGWMPGQAFTLNAAGDYIELAEADEAMFVAIDDNDELSTPPTGSLATVIFGSGTEFFVDHSEEVAASDASRVYANDVLTAAAGANLYVNNAGKWQVAATGSVKGKLSEIPAAANNYRVGIILRF
jgi:hypothetical protein